eukprot:1144704-Pyramimonas_sp.AAC.1
MELLQSAPCRRGMWPLAAAGDSLAIRHGLGAPGRVLFQTSWSRGLRTGGLRLVMLHGPRAPGP